MAGNGVLSARRERGNRRTGRGPLGDPDRRTLLRCGESAADLLAAHDDNGALLWDFQDDELSTRFLGDLYQHLSDHAKKTYALLQTPEFVEEFILDKTLTPALKERPLEGFRLIDPTCGSGHFLLGAFHRLFALWQAKEPGLEPRALANKALGSVYGVDLNPFAVAISRFRLLVAAIQASGDVTLIDLPEFDINLAVGDSLLHGASQYRADYDTGTLVDVDDEAAGFMYSTEDRQLLRSLLVPGIYDIVVGNPPYPTVEDKALNALYRKRYKSCKGTYALTVPFMERFFQLARTGDNAGWVGKITGNSFMKNRFGSRLVESFLPTKDIWSIIDCEGAWIPGHNADGTPTVILIGRNRHPVTANVKAILGTGLRERPQLSANPGPCWIAMSKISIT